MSNLYEQWQPSIGERVRVVMRDETGAVGDYGATGTIVGVQREPHELYEVEYDAEPDARSVGERQTHALVELEPVKEPAVRLVRRERDQSEPPPDDGPTWQPTVGDRVMTRDGRLEGTITAVEQRGGDWICEIAYDHQPGEPERPQRASYSVRELQPLGQPSAAALSEERGPTR